MADPQASLIITLKDLASAGLTKLGSRLDKLKADIEGAGAAFAGIGAAIGLVGTIALKTAGQFQQWNIAFSTMLGSADKADVLLRQIRDFASKTPFQLDEVVEGSKRLLAFGITAQNVIPTLKVLGDVASGLGVPVDRLVTAFGQVRAAGRLMGQEVLQFTNAGVPILELLAQRFNVTTGAVKKMVEEGKVGFEDVRAVLFAATEEGGRFHNMMASQAKTLLGRWNELSDSVTKLANAIGEVMLPTALKLVNALIALIDSAGKFAAENKRTTIALVALVGAFGAFVGTLGAVVMAWDKIVAVVKAAVAVFAFFGVSMLNLRTAMLAFQLQAVIMGTSLTVLTGLLGGAAVAVGVLTLGYTKLKQARIEEHDAILSEEEARRKVARAMADGHAIAKKYAETTVEQIKAIKSGQGVYDELTNGIRGLTIAYEQVSSASDKAAIAEKIKMLQALRSGTNLGGGDSTPDVSADKAQKELEALQAKADAEIFLLRYTAEERDRLEYESLAQKLFSMGEIQRLEELDAARKIALDRKVHAERITAANNALSALASLQSSKNKEMAAVGKAAATTQTTIATLVASMEAYKALSGIPIIGPALGAAASAAIMTAGMAKVAQINAMPMAKGGLVMPTDGGTFANIAEAGGREAVLPLDDPKAMAALREVLGGGGQTIIQAGVIVADDVSLDELARLIDRRLYRLRLNNGSAFGD